MYRHILPIVARSLPQMFKVSLIGLSLYGMSENGFGPLQMNPVRCFTFKNDSEVDPINNLLTQVFKIGVDGDTIGYAFCIAEGVLVTAR